MGRPLKIKQSQTIDIGFNDFNNLDSPTQVPPTGMTGTEYLGVVGGGYPSGIATPANPTVKCTAFFPGGVGETDAYIITQKGVTKYLVASNTVIADGSFVVGNSYIIGALGTTNWGAAGASLVNAQVGDVFTATTVGGAGTGTVSSVAVCVLSNTPVTTLTAGEMQITVDADGVTFQASKLTNKYVWDFATPRVKYAANFFEGSASAVTTDASGAQISTWANGTGTYELGQVDDYTA